MPVRLRHDCTLHLQFRDVKMWGKMCLLDIKYGIRKEIASDLRKDDLEQNLEHKGN